MGQDNLKQKVSKGLLWNTIHNLSMKGIQFLLMLLSRLNLEYLFFEQYQRHYLML